MPELPQWHNWYSDQATGSILEKSQSHGSNPSSGKIFSLLERVQSGSGGHLIPIEWVRGALYPQIKQPGYEFDNLSPYSAQVNNEWSSTSTL
jgi:hypothetical protein